MDFSVKHNSSKVKSLNTIGSNQKYDSKGFALNTAQSGNKVEVETVDLSADNTSALPRPAPAPAPEIKYVTRYDLAKSVQDKLDSMDKVKDKIHKEIDKKLEEYMKVIPGTVRPPENVMSPDDAAKWKRVDELQVELDECLQQITQIEMLEKQLIDYERVRPYEEYYEAEDFAQLSKVAIKPAADAPYEEQDYYTYFMTDLKDNSKYVTNEQKQLLTYLYNKFGYEKSHNYLIALQDQINNSKGLEEAINEIKKWGNDADAFKKFMEASADQPETKVFFGVRSFASGAKDGVSKYFDDVDSIFDSTGTMTTLDYKQMWIMQMTSTNMDLSDIVTAEDRAIIEECRGKLTEWGYKVGTGTGYMLPSVLASAVVTTATGGVGLSTETTKTIGEVVGLGTMFVGEFGTQKRKALQNGLSPAKSAAYAGLTATVDILLEHYLGSIPGLSKLSAENQGMFKSMLFEGMQEVIQNYSEDFIDVFMGIPVDVSNITGETFETFLQSMAISAIFNGGSAALTFGSNAINMKLNPETIVEEMSKGRYDYVKNELEKMGVEIDTNTNSIKHNVEGGINTDVDSRYQNENTDTKNITDIDSTITDSQGSKPSINQGIVSMNNSTEVNTINDVKPFSNGINTEIDSRYQNVGETVQSGQSVLSMELFDYNSTSKAEYAANYMKSNINKYRYVNTNQVSGLNNQIKQNGLLHFTTAGDAILNSGHINPSGVTSSYGTKKTFFFAGIPDAGAVASNLDVLPLKAEAIKIDPDSNMLYSDKLRVREYDDGAISYDGAVDLSGLNASKQYFCLFMEGGKLVYKQVSPEFYNNYQNTVDGQQLTKLLANKKNVNIIKQDYYAKLSMKSAESRRIGKAESAVKGLNVSQRDTDLKSKLYSNIPKRATSIEKAKLLYNRLNQEVSYSPQFLAATTSQAYNEDLINSYKSRKIDMTEFNNRNIVCYNWADMYSETLTDNGIENHIRGQGHKWVTFTVDGKYYFADATNNYFMGTDIAHAQIGTESYGFFEVDEATYYSETFGNVKNAEQIGWFNEQWKNNEGKKVDHRMGYDYKSIKEIAQVNNNQTSSKELKRLGLPSNATDQEIANQKLLQNIFPKMESLGVLEGLSYYNIVANSEFTPSEKLKVNKTIMVNKGSSDTAVVFNVNDKTYFYGNHRISEVVNMDYLRMAGYVELRR